MKRKKLYLIFLSFIVVIIITLIIYFTITRKNSVSSQEKFSYSIEVKESLEYSDNVICIGEINGQYFYVKNLDEIWYKTKDEQIFIMEPLREKYLTLNILKLNMKLEETNYGELYRYDGTGNIGSTPFSIFIYNNFVTFSTYDYEPKPL